MYGELVEDTPQVTAAADASLAEEGVRDATYAPLGTSVAAKNTALTHDLPFMDDVCFVCFDDTPPLHRVCTCKTVVHSECLKRLVQTVPSHHTACPVCMHTYATQSRCTCDAAWIPRCIFRYLGVLVLSIGAIHLGVESDGQCFAVLACVCFLTFCFLMEFLLTVVDSFEIHSVPRVGEP